jgi:internalin A
MKQAYQEVERKINYAREENSHILNLSSLNLESIPEQVTIPTSVKILDLSNNKLTTFPKFITTSPNLQELNLSRNQLTKLPPDIKNLSSLLILDLSLNALEEISEQVWTLPSLKKFNLSNNNLISLKLPPSPIAPLTHLNLSHNNLSRLPEEIKHFGNLMVLNLEHNKLIGLLEEISEFSVLSELYLANNQLNFLPKKLYDLSSLMVLDIQYNNISTIKNIYKLSKLEVLNVHDNPLVDKVFPEIYTKKARYILDYFRSIKNHCQQLNEAKILIVGQPAVGKTSLVKKLVKSDFDSNEPITHGIKVERWSSKLADDREVRLNIWDFGGQEIMHATHQFFLTKRSLYIILINAREGEDSGKLEYWLKTAQKFGDNAPMLVVVNKIDLSALSLNRHILRTKYPMIKGFLETSCKEGEGIDQLNKAIQKELAQLQHIDDLLPISWFNVKQWLEEQDADYLPYQAFEELCKQKEVPKESQETLVQLLHDLGTVICFYKDWRLQDTYILNPNWVTAGVYKIITDRDLIEAKGVLNTSELHRILSPDRYPKDKHRFIIEMMRKFELCFAFDNDQDTLLIPDLFAKDAPPEIEFRQEGLLFNYQYDLLPSSIISRFIVRMKAYLQEGLYWRYGVKLVSLDKDNQALVWADLEQKKIYITVTGKEQGRRYLLQIIRAELQEINKSIPNLQITELIPLPEYGGKEVDYQWLVALQRKGHKTCIPPGVLEEVSINKLLEGIEALPTGKISIALFSLLRKHLSLDDTTIIWFLLFGEKLNDALPNCHLAEAIIELVTRAEKRGIMPKLIEILIEERADLESDIGKLLKN